METKAAVDPMIQKPYLLELARAFAGGRDLGDPLISPQHADLAGLPPLLIQVGSEETLLDDAVTLAGRAGAAGVAVTLEVWPEMIHAFPMFFPRVAASRRATAGAGAFMRGHFVRTCDETIDGEFALCYHPREGGDPAWVSRFRGNDNEDGTFTGRVGSPADRAGLRPAPPIGPAGCPTTESSRRSAEPYGSFRIFQAHWC